MRDRRSCRPPGGLSACRPTRRRLRPVTRVAGQGLTRAVRPSAVAVSAAAPPCAASASELPGPLAREGAASGALACSGVWPPGARGGPAPLLHGRRGPDATPEHLRVQGTGADAGLSLTREDRSIITPRRDFGQLSLVAQSTEIEQRITRLRVPIRLRGAAEPSRRKPGSRERGGALRHATRRRRAGVPRLPQGGTNLGLTDVAALHKVLTGLDPAALTDLSSEAVLDFQAASRGSLHSVLGSLDPSAKGIRPKVLEAYNRATGNPHMDLPRWLRHGSPVGITSFITPRGIPDRP